MLLFLFFFKQKTAYEMRISDWSSDVCSSDLAEGMRGNLGKWAPRAEPGGRWKGGSEAKNPDRVNGRKRRGRHAAGALPPPRLQVRVAGRKGGKQAWEFSTTSALP